MKYGEKFQKYLAGELDSKETKEIENDMEKMQVLLEHMDMELEEKMLAPEDDTAKKEGAAFTRQVFGAVRRKFRTYAMIAAASAIVIVLLIMYGLSPLMNAIYYAPVETKKEDGAEVTGLSDEFLVAMHSYMELFCGEKGFSDVWAQEEGYGKYSIEVQTQISGEIERYPLQLTRNHLYASDSSWNNSSLPSNAFTWRDRDSYCGLTKEEAKEKLEELPDSLCIQAAVSFDSTKNAQEILDFMRAHDSYYLYIPVALESNSYQYWGFAPTDVGWDISDYYDNEKYPYLDLAQAADGTEENITAQMLEQHMKSMVLYLKDQKEFGEIFSGLPEGIPFDENQYQAVYDDIERNGIRGYGAVVFATKEVLMDILEDSSVDGVYMMDSRLNLQ